ncbi:MAG: hypothetical protein CM15mP71_3640 [Candidatus Poseidoniales archaeon]|nr:MAG: hypothetical protein CM15mP71_3640 [Candidatus Poseidoniales archaeon]
MVEADLMKSAFDNCDFSGADLRKARLNLSNFRNCSFKGADIRGIRGRYAIWQGSDWWNAKLDEDLEKVLAKNGPSPRMLEELPPLRRIMPVKLSRRVDFPMLDMAGIAFYPRIFDLAHRFFEEAWEKICGIDYPTILMDLEIGFPS